MLEAQVRRTLLERRLVKAGEGVLIACSGGPDSVAMTHVLSFLSRDLDLRLQVAAVDHGLRPEAKEEVAQVGAFVRRLRLPFHGLRVQVELGDSLQAHARRARYDALATLAQNLGVGTIAVGHTQDDQAETVLLRLLRGTGLEGLGAIVPRRRDGVVRPLIDCPRSLVLAHITAHRLPFITDPSNDDRAFGRARVRHEILPGLLVEDPRVVEHLSNLADDARAMRSFMRRSARAVLAGLVDEHAGLAGDRMAALPKAMRDAVLRTWITERTTRLLGRAHVRALDRIIVRGRGEVLLGGGWVAEMKDGGLRLSTEPRGTRAYEGPHSCVGPRKDPE